MRQNLPVTGNEYMLRDGVQIVSRTDLKGIITFVNPEFIETSGFKEEELIGAPHNILRHPDMPEAAFKDLWETVQSGKSWSAMVKNRCKNGDHYWVEANITPEKQNGQIASYLSVRRKPTLQQIGAAEALYQKIRAGKATLIDNSLRAKIKRMSLASKIAATSTLIIVLCIGTMVLFTQEQAKATLDQSMLTNLEAQNKLVLGMVETYNSSLEKAATQVSNLFNAKPG